MAKKQANNKPPVIFVQHTTATRKNSLSKAQKVAVALGVLTLIGVLSTAIFACSGNVIVAVISNWDKLFGGKAEIAARTVLNDQRSSEVVTSVNTGIAKIKSANEQLQQDERISPDRKRASAFIANQLVDDASKEAPQIKEKYQELSEAIKSKDDVRADFIRIKLIQEMTNLQRRFSQGLDQAPELKKSTGPVEFQIGNEKTDPFKLPPKTTGTA